jgi:hypothetical protein
LKNKLLALVSDLTASVATQRAAEARLRGLGPGAAADLARLLADPDPVLDHWRWHLGAAVWRVGLTPAATDLLAGALHEPRGGVCWAAADHLSYLEIADHPGVVDALHHAADPECRMAAACILTEPDHPEFTPALARALSDPHPGVRAAACKSLGLLADPSAVPALRGMVSDPDPVVRRLAGYALFRMDNLSTKGTKDTK